jgi:SAM-dependent methyltransferase
VTKPSNNPQAEQMADESMVRTLASQAEAIWPQEKELLSKYALPKQAKILDLACGTGEISFRMAELWKDCFVAGVDIDRNHLFKAVEKTGDRQADFTQGDIFHLPFADEQFDLTVARHIHQAVPNAKDAVKELFRVTKRGGQMHVLAEDYSMMFFHPVQSDSDQFWLHGPTEFASAIGTDLRVGRKMPAYLAELGAVEVSVNYIVVDTLRVPREIFASIWEAWRDGYSESIVEHTRFSEEEVATYWREMIAAIRNPNGYATWLIPLVHGKRPS